MGLRKAPKQLKKMASYRPLNKADLNAEPSGSIHAYFCTLLV